MILRRYSKQRELILETVRSHTIHPTADEVYNLVKPLDVTISLGTVYRNLNLLAEDGLIKRIHIPGGADRFDGTAGAHSHVICSECGKIMDYTYDFSQLKDQICRDIGFECQDISFTLKGKCRECLSHEGSKNKNDLEE